MLKKSLLVLVIICIAGAGVFAQEDSDNERLPKNTITVDLGPTIIGIGIGIAGKMLDNAGSDLSSSGFGIGAQYERQIFNKFSVAGRFAYMGGGLGFDTNESNQGIGTKTSAKFRMDSLSFEGHARFYPTGSSFFLDGMLGFALLIVKIEGDMTFKDEGYGSGQSYTKSVDVSATRGYFKLGAKIGWRVDFGKPGGFIFEPAFGWSFGFGMGDTLQQRLTGKIKDAYPELGLPEFEMLDTAFWAVEKFIFIGGPRLSLAFGWKF